MNQPDSAKAYEVAGIILDGFSRYRDAFQAITRDAKIRFERADWQGALSANRQRLELYRAHVRPIADRLRGFNPDAVTWHGVKRGYHALSMSRWDAELAETFFNSVHRQLTEDQAVDDTQMFIRTLLSEDRPLGREDITVFHSPENGSFEMMRNILQSFDFSLPWRNLDQDITNILHSLPEERPEIAARGDITVEVLKAPFFRNKGAYLIGKLISGEPRKPGSRSWPVALPVLNDNGQLYVDTLICDEDEFSIMFSFTRAYFMVDTSRPRALINFLHEVLPNKKISELYAAVGLYKHGKTEFYRGFIDHLDNSTDHFVIAPGIKGMVMSVFLLPSYQTVFKVIKDYFPPQKNTTAAEVRGKYTMVKTHDRVGRMADTQEFQNISFPRERFAPELIEELQQVAANSLILTDDRVIIRHLYTERQMTPLNLYIETANDEELVSALDEYGNAIKQLAAANIFPGDMLLKNFGVTRHGRVVFYDYDEICYLTEVNFRAIPEPRNEDEAMSGEAWYSVSPNDVFPEEFRRFLFGKRNVKALFTRMHGGLFTPEYWRDLQDAIHKGFVVDVFPYRRKKRFASSSA
ncbi:MAG: bifunctional isocitrate dehydrogenase kinase/phosphatase [Gammaproteobacteria bacterium]|nr:bifunctional isocitrate dehydrogenase kinase/phosphatase [Gammaproteobacteria bacterium]